MASEGPDRPVARSVRAVARSRSLAARAARRSLIGDGASRGGAASALGRHSAAVQAAAAIVAVALTMIALVYAYQANLLAQETLREQQRVNADQLELNRLARERFERRYASRVSWWIDEGDEGIAHYFQKNAARIDEAGPDDVVSLEVIHVQNRAPVPVHDPAFVLPPIDGQTPWWLVGDIPPCTIVTYDLQVLGREGHLALDRLITPGLHLTFGDDTNGYWQLAPTALTRIDGSVVSAVLDFDRPMSSQSHAHIVGRSAAADCGESG